MSMSKTRKCKRRKPASAENGDYFMLQNYVTFARIELRVDYNQREQETLLLKMLQMSRVCRGHSPQKQLNEFRRCFSQIPDVFMYTLQLKNHSSFFHSIQNLESVYVCELVCKSIYRGFCVYIRKSFSRFFGGKRKA